MYLEQSRVRFNVIYREQPCDLGVEGYVFNIYVSAYSGRIQNAEPKVERTPARNWRKVKTSSKTVGT